ERQLDAWRVLQALETYLDAAAFERMQVRGVEGRPRRARCRERLERQRRSAGVAEVGDVDEVIVGAEVHLHDRHEPIPREQRTSGDDAQVPPILAERGIAEATDARLDAREVCRRVDAVRVADTPLEVTLRGQTREQGI